MPTVHFVGDAYRTRELCQTDDRTGEIISEDKRTRYCALVTADCKSPEGDMDVGMTLYVEMPMAKVTAISKDKRVETVGYHAALNAKKRLGRAGTWELYGTEHINFYGDEPLEIPASFNVEGDIQIPESLAARFREATKRHKEVERALEQAKDYLEGGMNYACNDASRISRAAHFIADCMRADGTPMMGGWNDEKSAVLLADVADLVKRKQPNHPNYQSKVSWIRSTLYSVRCPSYWAAYPPQPHLLDLR